MKPEHRRPVVFSLTALGLFCSLTVVAPAKTPPVQTVPGAGKLEDYIKKEDGALAYEIVSDFEVAGVRAFNVKLTSQEWRGMKWEHWLSVLIPSEVGGHRKAVLSIGGGSNGKAAPGAGSREAMLFGTMAARLKAPFAVLLQVPNQPLFDNLQEDNLIAYTFNHFLNGGGDDWPLLLPMVKSATRAMDALQGLAKEGKLKTAGGDTVAIDEFMVTGASKRGWTTWLTGAVDERVCAIAPMVIDVLNMRPQMEQQLKTYGEFSEMILPYTRLGIQERMASDEGAELRGIVDPYHYADQITKPKLILLGTNDPYWTADAAQLYYPALKGPKALSYLPNAGHGLGLEILHTMGAFFHAVLEGKPFPQVRAVTKGDNHIEVSWDGTGKAKLWKAESPNRDFRGSEWSSEELEGDNFCTCMVEAPEDGWVATFVSVTFPPPVSGAQPFNLSTPITIAPEIFPHDGATK